MDIREVETRIIQACKTLRALPDPDRKFQVFRSLWPETIKSTEDAYGYADAILPRFRPTPAQVSDYLVALGWARGMEWRDFRLVWWRSFDLSFRQIAIKIHKSDETARRRYKDIVIELWTRAWTESAMRLENKTRINA